jgi:hypothetical protein
MKKNNGVTMPAGGKPRPGVSRRIKMDADKWWNLKDRICKSLKIQKLQEEEACWEFMIDKFGDEIYEFQNDCKEDVDMREEMFIEVCQNCQEDC